MAEVNWRDWGDEAFEDSKRTGRPVLLDISAVWCHWCHVMDETTYSNPTVVDIINRDYIPVRVDNDRNPDINARYNMGGWPTTAFLTHNRDVITGSTYIPPERMAAMLKRVSQVYQEGGEDLIQRAETARSETEIEMTEEVGRSASMEDVEQVLAAVESSYDPRFGGFGHDQKFPFSQVLELLLMEYERTGTRRRLTMVTDTLNAMLGGELFDRVEGGMFRYATQRDWRVPHFEKMLDDNARIAQVLLNAYRITADEKLLSVAKNIFSYLENVLLDSNTGVFYGSQDADEEYYHRDSAGRKMLTPPHVDKAAYTDSNSALAIAYAQMWGMTENHPARDHALQIVSFLNALNKGPDGTICHYYENGAPHQFGNLADHVMLLLANIMCCQASADLLYLDVAKELVNSIVSAYGAPDGGFYDISARRASERGLHRYMIPMSENSTAARALTYLADLTADEHFSDLACRTLNALARQFTNYGIIASEYASSLILFNTRRPVVTVNADPGSELADKMIRATMVACGPLCSVKAGSPDGAEATVCTGTTCTLRTHDPAKLAEELTRLMSARISG
ncbi:MAG: DUF255 domain-containing protein [Armatimonadota bacterium]|nr:DUF255 domain-containing protein [bacterium]